MKRLFVFCVLCATMTITSFGETITSLSSGGQWSNPDTWDLGRVPRSTDAVIVTSNVEIINAGYAICNEITIGSSDGSGNAGLVVAREQTLSVLSRITINTSEGLINYGEIWGGESSEINIQNNGSLTNHIGSAIMNIHINFLPTQSSSISSLEGRIYGNVSVNSNNVKIISQLRIEGNIEVTNPLLGSEEEGSLFDIAVNGNITLAENAQIPTNGRMICDGTLSDNRTIKQGDVRKIDAFHPVVGGYWNLTGLPNHTDLTPLAAEDAPDMWALAFDYTTHSWSENFLHANDTLPRGEAIMLWSDEDYIMHLEGTDNMSDVVITKNITANTQGERWIALANPFSKPISIAYLMHNWNIDHTELHSPWGLSENDIQGHALYLYDQGYWEPFIFDPSHALGDDGFLSELESSYQIRPGEGFMVNLIEDREYKLRFTKDDWRPLETKSAKAHKGKSTNRFVDLALISAGPQVALKFAQNDNAEDGFDIYDAAKMFGKENIAEPYFIAGGRELAVQQVKSPYFEAQMNIRSAISGEVVLVVRNIPENYSVCLLDFGNEIPLSQGEAIPLEISEGENANRFVLKVTQTCVSLETVRQVADINIVNRNNQIEVQGEVSHTEVFNSLGQKVFVTSQNSFLLEGLPSGVYLIKAISHNNGVSKTQKVVLR